MSTIVYAKHLPYYETGHLAEVLDDMRNTGSPTIRVVKFRNKLMALEGSHRIAAAHYLGIPIKVVIVESDVDGCEDFYEKIIETLPKYEFEYVWKLEMNGMNI